MMSDGQLKATVLSVLGGPAEVTFHANDDGLVVIGAPPPGAFMIDPNTQLEDFTTNLGIVGDVAAKIRRSKRSP